MDGISRKILLPKPETRSLQVRSQTSFQRPKKTLSVHATKMIRFLVLLLLYLLPAVQAGTNAEGLAFLEENKGKPGVVTLPSGLQYKVLKKGKGPSHPTVDSPCSCHYEGKLLDGTKFDSSYDRGSPTTFAPNQVIRGWTEA